MTLYMKLAVLLHGSDAILPGAEQAVKNFVDTARSYSGGQLELFVNFVKVDFGPPIEIFSKDPKYGYFARETDLKKVLDDLKPCGIIRIYHHQMSANAFTASKKLPSDWSISAMALSYGVNPPYTAIAWDEWLKGQGSEPIENILIHEFLHQLETMFSMVGVKTFMGSHEGLAAYPDAFKVLKDSFKTPVPWIKLDALTGTDWKA